MKSIVHKIVLTIITSAVMLATTAGFAATDRVPVGVTITGISTYTDLVLITYDPPYANNLGCAGATANRQAVLDWGATPELKTMYAAILSAFLTNTPVGFGIQNCTSSFRNGIPFIYRVDM